MHTHAHTNAHVINSLVVLIGSCEVIGFHGVPAQCVAPHCHYHLQEQTDDKSPNEREQTQHGEFSAATFLRGVDSLMSYSTILLSEAQLARSSVCVTETKTHRTVKHLSVLSVNCNIFFFLQFSLFFQSLIGQGLFECLTSTGLKWMELKLSTPQVNERMGLLLCSSQMSTCWPHVANKPSCQ